MPTCSTCLQIRRRHFFHNGVCEVCDPYNADGRADPGASYPLPAVIAFAGAHHKAHGWVTVAEARDKGAVSSAARLWADVDSMPLAAAPDPDAWAWLSRLYTRPEESCSDYLNALVLLWRTGWVTRETWDLACSVYHAWTVERVKRADPPATPPAEEATGTYAGTEGKRSDIPGCQCYEHRSLGTDANHPEWGERFLIKFTAADGSDIVWFASAGGKFDPKPGGTYNIRATVKKHEQYHGKKQTIIQRPAEYDPSSGLLLHPPVRKNAADHPD